MCQEVLMRFFLLIQGFCPSRAEVCSRFSQNEVSVSSYVGQSLAVAGGLWSGRASVSMSSRTVLPGDQLVLGLSSAKSFVIRIFQMKLSANPRLIHVTLLLDVS